MKKYNVGFIGYGNMARAIVDSMCGDFGKMALKELGYKVRIAVTDVDADKLTDLPSGVVAVGSNAELVASSDVVFLAIKPQHAPEALKGLDFSGKIVVSIMASVSIETIARLTGYATIQIVRVMPNLNARIGMAISAYCAEGLELDERKFIETLLKTFGECTELIESHMNAATGLCGSGPAFVFKFVDALIQGGMADGLTREDATYLAICTVLGSVSLLEDEFFNGTLDIDALIASVCSKGGTTLRGVEHLDGCGFEAAVAGAVNKATARAEEMSAENEKR